MPVRPGQLYDGGTLLARLRLRESEREMIPFLMTEASQAIRKWCGQRDFVRQTYMQEYLPDLNGYCMLEQMPVNNVLRVRGYAADGPDDHRQPGQFRASLGQLLHDGQWYDEYADLYRAGPEFGQLRGGLPDAISVRQLPDGQSALRGGRVGRRLVGLTKPTLRAVSVDGSGHERNQSGGLN